MTESTGSTTPPEWYTNPPAWLTSPPAHQQAAPPAHQAPYSTGQHGSNDQDLITAIRAMPEQVVSALREAIQGAQQAQPSTTGAPAAQGASSTPAATQTGTGTGTGTGAATGEEPPKEQVTFADRWFSNKL
jgi:hypothetical protein